MCIKIHYGQHFGLVIKKKKEKTISDENSKWVC